MLNNITTNPSLWNRFQDATASLATSARNKYNSTSFSDLKNSAIEKIKNNAFAQKAYNKACTLGWKKPAAVIGGALVTYAIVKAVKNYFSAFFQNLRNLHFKG